MHPCDCVGSTGAIADLSFLRSVEHIKGYLEIRVRSTWFHPCAREACKNEPLHFDLDMPTSQAARHIPLSPSTETARSPCHLFFSAPPPRDLPLQDCHSLATVNSLSALRVIAGSPNKGLIVRNNDLLTDLKVRPFTTPLSLVRCVRSGSNPFPFSQIHSRNGLPWNIGTGCSHCAVEKSTRLCNGVRT